MTSGASQGLYVVVGIVIFGIFVIISYLLFRDKLQTGLADIYDDSTEEAINNVKYYNYINSEYRNLTYTYYESGWYDMTSGGVKSVGFSNDIINQKGKYKLTADFKFVRSGAEVTDAIQGLSIHLITYDNYEDNEKYVTVNGDYFASGRVQVGKFGNYTSGMVLDNVYKLSGVVTLDEDFQGISLHIYGRNIPKNTELKISNIKLIKID